LGDDLGESGFDASLKQPQTEKENLSNPFNMKFVEGGPEMLRTPALKQLSAKATPLLNVWSTCSGVIFLYSRFIKSEAIPMVLALEANGYMPYGRSVGFLKNSGVGENGGFQCRPLSQKKGERQGNAKEDKHTFKVAHEYPLAHR
jgi:hypothetical protein